MKPDETTAMDEVYQLVDEYRDRCLWFLRPDYYPQTIREAATVLEAIEKHGDRAAFQEAATLKRWFLQNSKENSAE